MTSPYTSASISGYNSSPPEDDGSAIETNQVSWSKHKNKLGDPLKTLAETINTNVDAAFTAIYDQTAEEANSLITPTNAQYLPGDVRRYGIVADDTGAATANTTALQALCDNSVTNGYLGTVSFPGRGTYHFDDKIPCRNGLHFDLMGSTLKFTKTGDANDTDHGAIHAIKDFSIENGTIEIAYTYVTGTNTFNALGFGGRAGSTVSFPDFFENNAPYTDIGDITVRNIDIDVTGGANQSAILMYGGLRNVLIENVRIEGNTTLRAGITYEYGWATDDVATADRESAHANGLTYNNIEMKNIEDTAGWFINVGAAYNVSITNFHGRRAFTGIIVTPGESLFFRPGDPEHLAGAKRNVTMKNIVMSEIESTGITVGGAVDNTGYLNPISIDDIDKVDLYDFSLDGFSILGGTASTTLAAGIISSAGKVDIRNGYIEAASNAIRLDDECTHFVIENVVALDGTSTAFRLAFATGSIFSPARMKTGLIRSCKIAGTTGVAINIDHAENVIVEGCRFGYETSQDGVSETTQTIAILLEDDVHLIAKNNYVAGNVGTFAYDDVGNPTGILINPKGIRTASAIWSTDGDFVSTVGDANATLTAGTDAKTIRYATTLTANRTVTLSTTSAVQGDKFRIVRTGLGAFTLDVGGLKTVPSATAAFVDVEYDNTAWVLTGYGVL